MTSLVLEEEVTLEKKNKSGLLYIRAEKCNLELTPRIGAERTDVLLSSILKHSDGHCDGLWTPR